MTANPSAAGEIFEVFALKKSSFLRKTNANCSKFSPAAPKKKYRDGRIRTDGRIRNHSMDGWIRIWSPGSEGVHNAEHILLIRPPKDIQTSLSK